VAGLKAQQVLMEHKVEQEQMGLMAPWVLLGAKGLMVQQFKSDRVQASWEAGWRPQRPSRSLGIQMVQWEQMDREQQVLKLLRTNRS
jgi:hypothetical protein